MGRPPSETGGGPLPRTSCLWSFPYNAAGGSPLASENPVNPLCHSKGSLPSALPGPDMGALERLPRECGTANPPLEALPRAQRVGLARTKKKKRPRRTTTRDLQPKPSMYKGRGAAATAAPPPPCLNKARSPFRQGPTATEATSQKKCFPRSRVQALSAQEPHLRGSEGHCSTLKRGMAKPQNP